VLLASPPSLDVKETPMITRQVCTALALATLVSALGCCTPICRRPATAVVSASPACCPPGAPAPFEAAPVPTAPPPVQAFSVPPPAAIR
jgi:hypothetical protein